jgi:hypothetical protein
VETAAVAMAAVAMAAATAEVTGVTAGRLC